MSNFRNPTIDEIINAIHHDRMTYDRNGNRTGWYKDKDIQMSAFQENTATIFVASTESIYVRVLKADATHKQIASVMNSLQTNLRSTRGRNIYAFKYTPSGSLQADVSEFERIDVLRIANEALQQDTPDEIFNTLLDSDEVKAESYAAKAMSYLYNDVKTRAKAVKRAKKMLAEIARGERIDEIELPAIEF
jgi:hypothetical protein